MTLRDQIAIAAMTEFLRHRLPIGIDREAIADSAYGLADAMLAARGPVLEGLPMEDVMREIASAIRELAKWPVSAYGEAKPPSKFPK